MGMRGSRDRIEPIYFQHQIFDFFSFFSGATLIFWLSLGPPGVPGPKIVKIIFIYFTESGKLESGGCRDTGSRNRQPAASARGNGFSVLRIFFNSDRWSDGTTRESRVKRPGNHE